MFLESVKGQKAAYGVTALGAILRLSLKKSWKAGKHEHAEKGIGAEWSTDSILAFSISHKPCRHIWIIVSQLNNCYDCYFQFSANYFNLEINYRDLSKMHLKDLQLSATKWAGSF